MSARGLAGERLNAADDMVFECWTCGVTAKGEKAWN